MTTSTPTTWIAPLSVATVPARKVPRTQAYHCQSTAASVSPVEHRLGACCTGFHMVAKNTALYYRRGLYYRGFHEVCTITSLAITPLIFLPSYTELEGAPPLRRVFPGTRSSYCMEHIRLHFPGDLFGTVGRLIVGLRNAEIDESKGFCARSSLDLRFGLSTT